MTDEQKIKVLNEAAPQMLVALKLIEKSYGRSLSTYAFSMIRATIAKAEGRGLCVEDAP